MQAAIDFNSLGKEALRTSCREAGISYSKLNNEGMRLALTEHYAALAETDTFLEKSVVVEEINEAAELEIAESEASTLAHVNRVFSSMFGAPVVPVSTIKGTVFRDGKAAEKTIAKEKVKIEKIKTDRVSRKGYSIQKGRETKNGVKRPSEGTICAQVWLYLDNNPETKAGELNQLSVDKDWDRTTLGCQFYAWRKFMGIKGRSN